MPPNELPTELLLQFDLSRLWADVWANFYVDSMCFEIFRCAHRAHFMFSTEEFKREHFAHVIVNNLLVLIPTLVLPLRVFYNFLMLDG